MLLSRSRYQDLQGGVLLPQEQSDPRQKISEKYQNRKPDQGGATADAGESIRSEV